MFEISGNFFEVAACKWGGANIDGSIVYTNANIWIDVLYHKFLKCGNTEAWSSIFHSTHNRVWSIKKPKHKWPGCRLNV